MISRSVSLEHSHASNAGNVVQEALSAKTGAHKAGLTIGQARAR
ncbi:hypothetical protein [Acetobacter senegalensis]|nr:hypothetical protein [Acetobacter senegalensis]